MASNDENYGFNGDVPVGVSVQQNIARALDYQSTHTAYETAAWFYETVRNNRDSHMSQGLSMDYKQIDKKYEDFGNYNYAVVGKALGYADGVLRAAAGYAQGDSRGKIGWAGLADPANFGDAPEDQFQIWKGIVAADANGISLNWNVSQNLALAGFVANLISGGYTRMPGVRPASENILLGLSPTGDPLNVTIGDPLGDGSSTWLKDLATGSFVRVVSRVDEAGVVTTQRIDYAADGSYVEMRRFVTSPSNTTAMVFDDLPSLQQQLDPVVLLRSPDVLDGPATYVVKQGETLWSIAQENGWNWIDLKAANPQISNENLIFPGQKINGLTATSVENSFSSAINTAPDTTLDTPDNPTQSVSSSGNLIEADATHTVTGLTGYDVNAVSGNQQAANAIIGDDYRPGASEILYFDDWGVGSDAYSGADVGAYTNSQATGATQWTPVDPLVLDLNSDGVKLTSFGEAPVLFDIDHDGTASKEITGWASKEDGIVVMDLNGNGKIDGIHETMSEYFNGQVGTGGSAGTKTYANGFAALKSLDSNADNQFTSSDAAWNSVKVWVDGNHDGKTDAGELKTLAESALCIPPMAAGDRCYR